MSDNKEDAAYKAWLGEETFKSYRDSTGRDPVRFGLTPRHLEEARAKANAEADEQAEREASREATREALMRLGKLEVEVKLGQQKKTAPQIIQDDLFVFGETQALLLANAKADMEAGKQDAVRKGTARAKFEAQFEGYGRGFRGEEGEDEGGAQGGAEGGVEGGD